jgi:hypothetical protein
MHAWKWVRKRKMTSGIMGRSPVGLGAFECTMPYLVWFKLGMPNIFVQCSIRNLTCSKWVPEKNWPFSQCAYCTLYTVTVAVAYYSAIAWLHRGIYLLISHFEAPWPNVPSIYLLISHFEVPWPMFLCSMIHISTSPSNLKFRLY